MNTFCFKKTDGLPAKFLGKVQAKFLDVGTTRKVLAEL